jgi:hypothetical protein
VTSAIGRNGSDDVNRNMAAPRGQVPTEYTSNLLSRPGVGNYLGQRAISASLVNSKGHRL